MSTVPPPPSGPHQPGSEPSLPVSPPSVPVAGEVAGPATGLLITAIIGGSWALFGVVVHLLGISLSAVIPVDAGERLMDYIGSGFALMGSAVGLLIAGFVAYASLEMKKLRQWGLAVTASILAMIPCISPCCIIGLPMGVWSLVVLLKDEVKAAFH